MDLSRQQAILLVEDDQSTRDLLRNIIARRFPEFNVITAENGQAGLESFRLHAPQVVITDIKMPVMDGIKMAGAIRQLQPDIQFIVLTAYNNKTYMGRFNEIGYCAYLAKPIEFSKLFEAVERCCAEAAAHYLPETHKES